MIYKPLSSFFCEFITTNPLTGTVQNADSLPVAIAVKNGNDDASFSLTVTNIDTGRYKVTGTVPSSYSAGDRVQIVVSATISGISGKAIIDNFQIDTKYESDTYADMAKDSTVAKEATLNTIYTDMAKDNTVLKASDYVPPDNVSISSIKSQTDKMMFSQTNLIKASVEGMANDVINSSTIAPDAITEIADGVNTKLTAEHGTGSWTTTVINLTATHPVIIDQKSMTILIRSEFMPNLNPVLNSDGTVDITAKQGTTWRLTLELSQSNGQPVDLTGYSVRSHIRKNYTDTTPTAVFTCSILNPPTGGKIELLMDATTTASIKCGKTPKESASTYVYDIEIESAEGFVTRILEGKIYIDAEATK